MALRWAREHCLEWASGDRPALPCLHTDTLALPPSASSTAWLSTAQSPRPSVGTFEGPMPTELDDGVWEWTWASSLSQPLCHQLWWPHCSQRPNRVILPHANAHRPASSPLSPLGGKISPKDLSLVTFPIYIWLQ